MIKINQLLEKIPFHLHMGILVIWFILFVFSLKITMYNSPLVFILIFVIYMVFFFVNANSILKKSVENYCICFQKVCLNEVKVFLNEEYIRLYLFKNSKLNKEYIYYGKINKKNVISIYALNNNGEEVYQNSDNNYVWFLRNFYTI